LHAASEFRLRSRWRVDNVALLECGGLTPAADQALRDKERVTGLKDMLVTIHSEDDAALKQVDELVDTALDR
jgi:hypothetical protein